MYHFLFIVSNKLFRNFSKERKIDPEKEQIIDFCPKCNEQLPDKKVITLLNHDKKFHPKTEKELVKDFYRKGSVQMYVFFTFLLLGVLGVYVAGQVSTYFWESELTEAELIAYEFCKDLNERYPDIALPIIGDVEQSRKDRSDFIFANLEDLEKCNYAVNYYAIGGRDAMIEHYLSVDG